MDRIDPAEPMERIDPLDPMDKMDPLDPMDRIEPDEPDLPDGRRVVSMAAVSHTTPTHTGGRSHG
jgi:hypothetical protein